MSDDSYKELLYDYSGDTSVEQLLGVTLTQVVRDGDDAIYFVKKYVTYKMHHRGDCRVSVSIAEVIGDLDDLVGSPIVEAELASSHGFGKEIEHDSPLARAGWTPEGESWTWSFYRFRTAKGSVVIRWLGESNGYYSESVTFTRGKR